MKQNKKPYFICPLCKKQHKIQKTKDLSIVLIQCDCGADSLIQVKDGYHIPSKRGVSRVV